MKKREILLKESNKIISRMKGTRKEHTECIEYNALNTSKLFNEWWLSIKRDLNVSYIFG